MSLVFVCAASTAALAGGAAFSVRPGDDLVKTRNAARAALAKGESVVVTLAPGTYPLAGTLTFEKADSGTAAAPAVWRAEKPGTVRLCGGRVLHARDFKPVADPAMRERLPAAVRDRVRCADLSKIYPKPLPPWQDGFSQLPPGPWPYVAGRALPIARWPNPTDDGGTPELPVEKGWATFTNSVDCGVELPNAEKGTSRRVWPGALRFANERARRWRTDSGVWMFGYWSYDWHGDFLRVAKWNPQDRVVRFAGGTPFGLAAATGGVPPKRRFYVLNLPEELDEPGEWWMDRANRVFYVLPPEGADEIVLAEDRRVVLASGVRHLRLDGFAIAFSHGLHTAGLSVGYGSEDVVVSHCTIEDHGGVGAYIGGRGNRLEDSVVRRTGEDAADIDGGDRKALANGRNAILRCDVSEWARLSKGTGIRVNGCGNAVRNCRIHEGPTCAIGYLGNEHLLADNDIYRAVLEDCDAGAVYSGYDSSSQGNLLFGNRLRDIGADRSLAKYRQGFYFDDCDWGDAVIGNSVSGVGRAVLLGGGSMHPICNNVFADCLDGVQLFDRARLWRLNWRGEFSPDPKTGVGWAESKCLPFNYRAAPWSVAYPRLSEILDDNPEYPRDNVVSNNVFVRIGRMLHWSKEAKQSNGVPESGWNRVETNAAATVPAPFHPVELAAAVRTALRSPDGKTEAVFALDVAGRLSWRLAVGGVAKVEVSPLGVTVDGRDFGKLVVPGACVPSEGAGPAATNLMKRSCQRRKWGGALPPGWKGGTIPLADLVTGATAAALEVRVFNGGAAYRWRVPGTGRRRVKGELNAWALPDPKAATLLEGERPAAYPESETQERAKGFVGLTFPEFPRGWSADGEVVTPWRVTVCCDSRP